MIAVSGLMQNSSTCSCHYHNDCLQLAILRCIDSDDCYLEKVIFPWEDSCFESKPDSRVEICSYGQGGVELLHILYARDLVVSGSIDPRWVLELQQPVRTDLSWRGLQGGFTRSPSNELAVPC